jgi:hypothetical protein
MATEKRLIDAHALIDEIDGIYQRHYINSSYQSNAMPSFVRTVNLAKT